jgi:hypothetical protein
LRKFIVYRDGASRRPYSNTPIYQIDHIDRYADGGPTTAANAEGLGTFDHVTRDLPGWSVATVDGDAGEGVRWTTPTGHAYESRPPPILGWGNTRPPRRARHRLVRCVVDLRTRPVNAEHHARHRPRRN